MTQDDDVKDALVDRIALAATAWAEGRGDWREGHSSVEERIAVMVTARNRRQAPRRFQAIDATYRAIVFAPWQFSCWNPGADRNHAALFALLRRILAGDGSGDRLFDETLFLADGVISGALLDNTGGATFYYAPKAMVPAYRVPSWAVGKIGVPIGSQLFFNL